MVTHWVSREKNNAKLYENGMTTGKELSISESPWDFALCKVLFRYTREIGGSLYKREKKSVKMSGILLELLLPTTGDMDEKI